MIRALREAKTTMSKFNQFVKALETADWFFPEIKPCFREEIYFININNFSGDTKIYTSHSRAINSLKAALAYSAILEAVAGFIGAGMSLLAPAIPLPPDLYLSS